MKKIIMVIMLMVMVMLSTSQLYASTYNVDPLVANSILGNSGEATETAFLLLQYSLNCHTFDFTKFEEGGMNWTNIEGNIWSFDFGSDRPNFFMIKTGNLKLFPFNNFNNDHFLFENIENKRYGIIDLDCLCFGNNMNIDKISHISYLKTDCSPVPISPSMVFLLSGMCGFFLIRRRK